MEKLRPKFFKGSGGRTYGPALFRLKMKILILMVMGGGVSVPLMAQSVTGVIPGDFMAGNGGAAYNLSLQTPPGIQGLQPRLSLMYSSSGNRSGLLGTGFTLTGLSTISRCGATIAEDGFTGGVNYNGNDRLCMDGQPLKQVGSGEYWRQNREYRNLIEGFNRIVSVGRCGEGHCSFTVYGKRGRVFTYGQTIDSRVSPEGREDVRRWALNQVRDRNGNVMNIEYDKRGGYALPRWIRYSNRTIQFSYTANNNPVRSYEDGSAYIMDRLLFRVDMITGDSRYKHYDFSYEYSARTGAAQLTRVQECDQNSNCLEPTRFVWSNPESRPASNFDPVFEVRSPFGSPSEDRLREARLGEGQNVKIIPGDFNGDGKQDFIRQGERRINGVLENAFSIYFSKGDGTFEIVTPDGNEFQDGLNLEFDTRIIPGDFNGDGRMDFIRQHADTGSFFPQINEIFHVYLSTENGYFRVETPSGAEFQSDLRHRPGAAIIPGDYNGDGLTDFIRQEQGEWSDNDIKTFSVYFSNGDGTFRIDHRDDLIYQRHLRFNPGAKIIPGDYNGDGRTDFIRQERGGWSGDTDNTFNVYLSRGDGSFDVRTPEGSIYQHNLRFEFGDPSAPGARIIPGDYNGDGLTDFIRQELTPWNTSNGNILNVYLSKGDGNFRVVAPDNIDNLVGRNARILPGDFNGDGRMDFIRQDSWNFGIFISQGDGNFQLLTSTDNSYQEELRANRGKLIPGDFNGDGRLDFIRQGQEGIGPSSDSVSKLYLNKGNLPDLVTFIEEGANIVHTLRYQVQTDDSVYTGTHYDQGTLKHFRAPVYLLSRHSKIERGGAGEINTNYHYFYARFSKVGRGFAGFGRVDVHSETLGTNLRRYYHTEFPHNGRIYNEQRFRSLNNQKLNEKWYTWKSPRTAHGTFVTNVTQERERQYEENGSYETRRDFSYDAYGNMTHMRDLGDVSHGGDDLSICARYSNDTQSRRFGFVLEKFRAASCSFNSSSNSCSCSGVLQRERKTYDGNMNVSTLEQWVDTDNSWLLTSYNYDSYGNPIRQTSPSGKVTEIEYETEFNTYPARRIEDAAGFRLTANMEYDPRYGALVRETDYNGNSFRRVLGSFGRVIELRALNPQGQEVPIRKYAYYRNGFEIVTETLNRKTWEADTWRKTLQYRNGFGHRIRETVQGDSDTGDVIREWEYNPSGLVSRESLPFFVGQSPVWRTFSYDKQNRPVFIEDETGRTHLTTYGIANQSRCPTALLEVATFSNRVGSFVGRNLLECRDSSDRVIRRLQNNQLTGSFGFDLLGRRTLFKDSKVESSVKYDTLGRRTEAGSTNTGILRFFYDAQGRLKETLDALGRKTELSYDGNDRVIERTFFDNRKILYEYDNEAFTNARGRLTGITGQNAAGETESRREYAYNRLGKVSVGTLILDGKTYASGYEYDPAGELLANTYPDGSVARRNRNMLGFLSSIQLDSVRMARYTNLTAAGQPGSVTYANGVETRMEYDSSRRLTYKRTDALDDGGGTKTALEYDYLWTAHSEISQIKDRVHVGEDQSFSYDGRGFLKSASGVYGSLSYTYDGTGNLTVKDGVDYTYIGHQLRSGSNGLNLSYDALGRRTAKSLGGKNWEYGYHSSGRMASVKKDGSLVAAYLYDGNGRRVKKTDKDGTVSVYVSPEYDIARFSDGREVHTRYLIGPAGRVAAVTNEFTSVSANLLEHAGYGVHGNLYNTASLSGLAGFMSDTLLFYAGHPLAELHLKYALLILAALVFSVLFGYYFFRSAAMHSHLGRLRVLMAGKMKDWDFWSADRAEAFAEAVGTDFMRRNRKKSVVMPALVFCFTAFFVMNCGADKSADVRSLVGSYLGTEVLGNGLSHADLRQALSSGDNGQGYPVPGTYFYHQDQVGSTSLVTDARGVEISRVIYKPFGEIHQPTSTGFDVFRDKFGGKELDRDVDLYYFNARYYDGEIGRFVTADTNLVGGPEEHPASLNRYHFSGNNPITYSDPSGNFFITKGAILFATIAGGVLSGAAAGIAARINGESFSAGQFFRAFGIGAFVGFVGAIVGPALFQLTSMGLAALTIGAANPVFSGFLAGFVSGALEGAFSAFLAELISGNTSLDSVGQAVSFGALTGGLLGGVGGAASVRRQAYTDRVAALNREIDQLGARGVNPVQRATAAIRGRNAISDEFIGGGGRLGRQLAARNLRRFGNEAGATFGDLFVRGSEQGLDFFEILDDIVVSATRVNSRVDTILDFAQNFVSQSGAVTTATTLSVRRSRDN